MLALAWPGTEATPAMFKVAFATDDRVSVNQHFGAAAGFAIYALDAERGRLVQAVEFADATEAAPGAESAYACPDPRADSRSTAVDHAVDRGEIPEAANRRNEGRLDEKIRALAGCAAVYCLAVGASAVRQLLAEGIQPIRLADETAIELIVRQLCAAIRSGGVAWIDRLTKRPADAARFERMAAEGWQE